MNDVTNVSVSVYHKYMLLSFRLSQTQKLLHGRNRLEMVMDVPLSSTFNLESVTEFNV